MYQVHRNGNLMTMPTKSLNAKRLKTNAKKFLRFLSLVTCQMSFVTILSACTAIGTSKPAALQITSTPQASIFLDGKHIGKTPFSSDQLNAREYQVKLAAGEATYVEKVTLGGGTLTVINRELNNNFLAQSGEVLSLVAGKKGLFVVSTPPEADLTVDGALLGKTPFFIENIQEGEHKVTLTKAGFITREFVIKTSDKYRLVAEVTQASEIAKGTGESAPNPTPASTPKVEITQTPQGFLRVRSEPSLSAPEIGRVKTGDQFEVIQETEDWLKISFQGPSRPPSERVEAGKQGWVSSQYVKKLQ